jgi:hypothetical protein
VVHAYNRRDLGPRVGGYWIPVWLKSDGCLVDTRDTRIT